MNERQIYIDRILNMVNSIENVEWLAKIYSFVKVFADDGGGYENVGRNHG